MNNPTAKRLLEKFDSRTHILAIVGQDKVTDSDVNDAIYAHFERSTKLDGKIFKLWSKIATKYPEHAAAIKTVLDEAAELVTAAKNEAIYEKEAKAARIAARAAKAKNVTKNGVQLGKITPEAFETLANILAPVRHQYAEAAEQRASRYLSDIGNKVEDAGSFDLAFPALSNKGFAMAARSQANYALRNPEAYKAERRAAAQAEVDTFVVKLAGKIGKPVTSGVVVGDLWHSSKLTVQTAHGEQVWFTHCIINTSVNGKAFNQWPTRRGK